METPEITPKTPAGTTKIDGISAQINLSPGSETHRKFAELMRSSGETSARAFVDLLLDIYENPPQVNKKVADLTSQVEDLKSENQAYDATVQNLEQEKADLKQQLQEANRIANENAEHGLGQQAQIEELKGKLNGAIIFRPNPVVEYFLLQMKQKTGKEPAEILQSLFIEDLQNPTANNLPYIVSDAEIRRVMNELKAQKDVERQQE